ncbi:MAG: sigma-70 family RNA polymerase sigma factor [Planctomycetes bacterium]|nr:sigma-70 family RNA polymerase sigma factor [Planctomycetota bacterium]
MADDLSLLKQYAETRNADAFAELARRYAGMVYGSCLRVIGNTHDAEDVAQECFLELARAAGSVETSLPGWLHLAATRRSVDAVRRSAARKRHEEQAAMKPNNNSEPTWAEIAPHVDAAIDELPEEFCLPFILHYLQGRSQAEVAGELSVDQSTVSRRIEKSISQLRDHLKKAGWVISAGALGALLAHNTACAAPAAVMAALGKMAASGVGGSAGSAVGGVASATASGVLGTLKAKLIVGAIAGLAVTAGVLTQNPPEDPQEKPGDAPAEVSAPNQDAPHRPVPVEVTPELEQLLHDAMKLHVLAHAATRDFHGRVVEIKGNNTTAYGGLGVRLSLDGPLPFDLAFNVRWAPKDFKRTYAGKKADSFTLVQGETQRDFQMPPDMIDDMLAELSSWAGQHAYHRVKITLEPAPERALEDPRVKAYWPKPIELPNIELNFRVKPNLYTFASPADVAERKKELYSPDLVAKRMAAWDLSL